MSNYLILRDDNDLEERYTPEEMYEKILEYFSKITRELEEREVYEANKSEYLEVNDGYIPPKAKKPTTSGLAMFLGFADRRDMNKVQVDGQYALIIRRGISMIEEYMEQELYSAHCGGAKFWLKNHGWVESQPKDFGEDKVYNVMIDAEVIDVDPKKEELELIELKKNLKEAGLDTKETIDIDVK